MTQPGDGRYLLRARFIHVNHAPSYEMASGGQTFCGYHLLHTHTVKQGAIVAIKVGDRKVFMGFKCSTYPNPTGKGPMCAHII